MNCGIKNRCLRWKKSQKQHKMTQQIREYHLRTRYDARSKRGRHKSVKRKTRKENVKRCNAGRESIAAKAFNIRSIMRQSHNSLQRLVENRISVEAADRCSRIVACNISVFIKLYIFVFRFSFFVFRFWFGIRLATRNRVYPKSAHAGATPHYIVCTLPTTTLGRCNN